MSTDVQAPDQEAAKVAGYARYLPAMAFGLRVAALAGVVMSSGAAAALGLAGVFDDPVAAPSSWPWPGSSCCPQ
jgi:hypothetical protein